MRYVTGRHNAFRLLLFLNLWDFSIGGKSDFGSYLPHEDFVGSGFVQPFGDNPLDELCVAENVLMMALMRAKQYFYITTPYLIPDSEVVNAPLYRRPFGGGRENNHPRDSRQVVCSRPYPKPLPTSFKRRGQDL